MAGNLSEWTQSAHTSYPPPQKIPPIWQGEAATGSLQIVRGGMYLTPDLGVRVTIRIPAERDYTFRSVGVRCALSAPSSP